MLPGFRGHLLSESFLEEHVNQSGHAAPASLRRDLDVWRHACSTLGPASPLRAMVDVGATPLVRALGFDGISGLEVGPSLAVAGVAGPSQAVTLLVTAWGDRLDALWRPALLEARRRSTAWGLLFNGTDIRLIDAARVHTRRFVEFDIDRSLDDDRMPGVWWCVMGAPAITGPHGEDGSLPALIAASEAHAGAVSRSLRSGVLAASSSVLDALVQGSPTSDTGDAFEQALTIVYRLLFLLFAESRGLAPLWHPVYRESYSVAAMRDAAESGRPCVGLWDALRATSRLAHAGCRAGSLRVTAFNGRLFAPSRTPLIERGHLDDRAARDAILALTTRPAVDRAGRERIAYRDLGVEQLGAVYETLLDYEPRAESDTTPSNGHRRSVRARTSLRRGSGLRKSTGTFYTPQPIADYLTRRTLRPLVLGRAPGEILALKVLDPACGSGAFLVAACQYLAHAYEGALVDTGQCHPGDLGPAERVAIRRTVAERCVYGVDLNPMAVQLARLSLWLATLAADKPLGFLDHHLLAGNSLLGAWLSNLSQPPAGTRMRATPSLPLFDEGSIGAAFRQALPIRFSLASIPDDTADVVGRKERWLTALNARDTALSRWKRVADLWCARWFSSDQARAVSAFRDLSDTILTGHGALRAAYAAACLDEAERIAASQRFVHWELEFPEVFFDPSGARLPHGGFDAVLSNPPWEMARADGAPAEARQAVRSSISQALRFTRDSGVYSAQSTGHANQYQAFVERAVALTRAGGRLGLAVPSGFATDHGSAPLRRFFFSRCAADALVGFENRLGIFPIHRSVRFLLATATAGQPTAHVSCRLGEVDPRVLDDTSDGDDWFPVRVSTAGLRLLSGDDLAIPDIRLPIDLGIAERAAALFRPLGDPLGWDAHFGRELNATDDREHFGAAGDGLPVIEGRALSPFRIDLSSARRAIAPDTARRLLGARHTRARLAYRDVASATNRQTLIAALLPPGSVSTHTVYCLRTPLSIRSQHFLCGLFNSFVVNYLVRLRVTLHVTAATVERLPVPRRAEAPAAFDEVAAMARLLARPATDPAAVTVMLARLNAVVARLYQLTPGEFDHVLGTFPLVPREQIALARRAFARHDHGHGWTVR